MSGAHHIFQGLYEGERKWLENNRRFEFNKNDNLAASGTITLLEDERKNSSGLLQGSFFIFIFFSSCSLLAFLFSPF